MHDFKKIYDVVSKIPKGKVMTYKQVAQIAGIKNPRYIGFAIHRNTDIIKVPCHRVIKSDGELANGYAHGGMTKQREKLLNEGIVFKNERVDLEKFILN